MRDSGLEVRRITACARVTDLARVSAFEDLEAEMIWGTSLAGMMAEMSTEHESRRSAVTES